MKEFASLKVFKFREENTTTTDYSKMTLAQLKVIAKEQGVSGYSTMKKDELIANLK